MGMKKFVFLLLLSAAAWGQSTPQTPSSNDTDTKHPTVKQEVVVTGTYEPVPLDEIDRTVESYAVEQSPVVYRSWADVLQDDPSIDLRQRAPGVSADLSLRGSSFGQTLVLINGLRVNDAQTGHNNLDLPFPFESVQRVEVLHGSGSTLYGSDAVGGAVNFIAAIPQQAEFRIGAAGGNDGLNAQNASASMQWRSFGEQLTLNRELSTGFMPDRDYRNLAFASESTLRSRLGRSDLLLGYSDRPFGAAQFYGNFPSWERTKGWLIAATQDLGKNTQAAFGMRRHTDLFVLFRNDPGIYKNSHLEDSYEFALRRHDAIRRAATLYYGFEGDRDTIDSNNLGQHQRNRGAIYTALDLRPLGRFSVTAGAREEFFSGDQQSFSPTVSAGYWLSSRFKLKASASHAFRLPTFTDLYYSDPANVGNPNLRPERAWDFETGVDAKLASHISAQLTVFHRRDRDVIDYVRMDPAAKWQAMNIQALNFTGVESALRMDLGRQRFDVAYTALHGSQQTLREQSKYVFQYPSNEVTASWLGRLPANLQGRVRVGALQRFQQGAYPLAEVQVAREWRHVAPYVQLTNATNTGFEEIPGVRMPGREVMAGVELRWRREK